MDTALKDLRKARKMTQRELGQVVGVSNSTISRYERGEFKTIEPRKIAAIASHLGVTVDRILPTSILAFLLSPTESEALELLRAQTAQGRAYMLDLMRTAARHADQRARA